MHRWRGNVVEWIPPRETSYGTVPGAWRCRLHSLMGYPAPCWGEFDPMEYPQFPWRAGRLFTWTIGYEVDIGLNERTYRDTVEAT